MTTSTRSRISVAGACKFSDQVYNERIEDSCKVGCPQRRAFRFQCADLKKTVELVDTAIPPLEAGALSSILLFPFTTDPFSTLNLTRSRFDEGRKIQTTITEAVDYSPAVFTGLTSPVVFRDLDFIALQKIPVIVFFTGSIRVEILARKFQGTYILETSPSSPNQASELPLTPSVVNAELFTSAYQLGKIPFMISFDM